MTKPLFVCTPETPWSPGKEAKGQRIHHPDAVEGEQEDDWYGTSYAHFSCPNCGHSWKEELPQ